jgi:hypothetical protein
MSLLPASAVLFSCIGVALFSRGNITHQRTCRSLRRMKIEIGMAIIAVATGERIGMANRALIMAMHMYQLNMMSAK